MIKFRYSFIYRRYRELILAKNRGSRCTTCFLLAHSYCVSRASPLPHLEVYFTRPVYLPTHYSRKKTLWVSANNNNNFYHYTY